MITIKAALSDYDIPYTPQWVGYLIRNQKVRGVKVGEGRRGQWLVDPISLIDYTIRMVKLGSAKHDPG